MIIGALADAGLDVDALERELRRLPVSGWSIRRERVHKHGIAALYVDVVVPGEDHHAHAHDHHHESGQHEHIAHRRLGDVLRIVNAAGFSETVTKRAEKIYRRLAEAEAHVHGSTMDEVLFHEVGQIDAIIDIAGASLALEQLGIQEVYCSALPFGTGRVHSAHGAMPSPAPATVDLMRGFPTLALNVDGEFVTPTGAAILTSVASFEVRPAMRLDRVGYGSGRSDFPFPNVLRVLIGDRVEATEGMLSPALADVVQLETNIDDMNPQWYDLAVQRLFAAGALDVWSHPIAMKKGRTGILLAALASPERADAVAATMLHDTTSIGVRRSSMTRDVLPRRSATVQTSLGPVSVKIVGDDAHRRVRPEYEDCLRIAQQHGLALPDAVQTIEADIAVWLREQREQ